MSKIIAARYTVIEQLGSGGMGTVYKAMDNRTQQTVAIKQLHPTLTNPELIERFKREGEALRDLDHPNMVKMLNAIEEDGNHFLIMEYITGGDLKDVIKQGQLPIERCLRITIDIADALTRSHKLNIIHRDLKPANVLIAFDGTAHLTDFGVAHVVNKERITDTDAIVGTIDYLAPEVFGESHIDYRSDIWAFGVMLFELLTGDVPFTGDNIVQKIMAISNQAPPDLETLRSNIPIDLVDLVYRMLEKDRHARIVSMRHVGAALEDIMKGRSLNSLPETRFETPIPSSILYAKHNLPNQTTAFVGREAELVGLQRLLHNHRLITILASGGMGKTRLALAFAESQVENFSDGVCFVELAPLNDLNNIISAIANAINYKFQADSRDSKQQLLDFLAPKNMLLIMDNFEHLIDSASILTEILTLAPNVKILATSRQRLKQSGESVFNLRGMDFAEWKTPDEALESAAVKLFIQSARRVQAQFELTNDNMGHIAQVCRLTEGTPLAILLAASWLGMLSVEEIATEIARGIDFLESDISDFPERHRSIRSVFDYSWKLMSESERHIFVKLSVFRGGFTRDAAQKIAGANLRTLMNLMNKSLIRRDVVSGRYDIHELLRQYGETKLEKSGDTVATENAHAEYFVKFMADQLDDLNGRRQIQAIDEIETEWGNVSKSLISQWVWNSENFDKVRYSVEAIFRFAFMQNRWREIGSVLELVRASLSPDVINASNPTWQMFRLRFLPFENTQSQVEGILERLTARNDISEIAFCHIKLGSHFMGKLDDSQRGFMAFQKARELYEQLDYLPGIAEATGMMGWAKWRSPDLQIEFNRQAVEIWEMLGNQMQMAVLYEGIASTYTYAKSNLVKGQEYGGRSLNIALKTGVKQSILSSQVLLGWIAMYKGDFDTMRQSVEACLAINEGLHTDSAQCQPYIQLAIVKSVADTDYQSGIQYAQQALDAHTTAYSYALSSWGMSFPLLGLGQYTEAIRFSTRYLQFEPRVRRINSIAIFALFFGCTERYERCAELMGVCQNYKTLLGWMDKWSLAKETEDRAKQYLGEEPYNTAYERGKSLDLDVIVQEILAEFVDEINS